MKQLDNKNIMGFPCNIVPTNVKYYREKMKISLIFILLRIKIVYLSYNKIVIFFNIVFKL